MQVKVELIGGMMPRKATERSAAFDCYVPEDYELREGRQVVPLGFCIEVPTKANIRPRSGFSVKGMEAEVRTRYRHHTGTGEEEYVSTEKVRVDADVILGLIDPDYRDEVGVIVRVWSLGHVAPQRYQFDTVMESRVFLTGGTRIAQMEIEGDVELVEGVLNRDIDRGGGFGHTGSGLAES